jgi:hypothetical protein
MELAGMPFRLKRLAQLVGLADGDEAHIEQDLAEILVYLAVTLVRDNPALAACTGATSFDCCAQKSLLLFGVVIG